MIPFTMCTSDTWMISGFSHSYQLIIRQPIRIPWNNSQVYLQFHSVLDDWNLFGHNKIHVVFIDAAHDYASVKSDLDRALALPYAPGLAQKSWNFNRFLIFLRIPSFFSRILGVPIFGQVTSVKIFEGGETLWKVHVAG